MQSGGIRPPAPAAAAAAVTLPELTAEEEAIKRNTDCVYFLASPLTCKKGSECEYRHSEGARVNPRDCIYWFQGHCTNRKCAFRHPPLDALFGAPPTPAALVAPQATAYNQTKQSTPCYYFLKGNCIKGDRCPFMHVPPSSGTNTIPQQPAKVSASPVALSVGTHRKEPVHPAIAKPVQHRPFGVNNAIVTQEKPVPNASKPVLNFNGSNGAAPAIQKSRDDITVNNAYQLPDKSKTVPAINSLSDENHPKLPHNQYPSRRATPVQNNDRSDERPQDSREGDEFPGESSPGFDVIVDHDEEDSGYLPQNEEDFRRAFADPYDPAEMYPLDDYELMSRYERERERHVAVPEHEYEPEFGHEVDIARYNVDDQYDRKRRRRDSSSERALDQPSRRRSHREEAGIGAETGIDGSDLRHRLMNKQRKVNGASSRSDVSPAERYDRHHRHSHRRDERYPEGRDQYRNQGNDCADLLNRGAIHGSNRFQGRIQMPLRQAEKSDFIHEDIGMERGRHLRGSARVSPMHVDLPSRRHRERMGRRSSDREFIGQPASRRDDASFTGPKSLAELKIAKGSDKVSVSQGRVKERASDFEGPKPLSVILKRKREAAGVTSGNGSSSDNKSHNGDASPKEGPAIDALPGEQEVEGMIPEGNSTDYEVQVASKIDGTDGKEFEEGQEMEEPYDETRGGEELTSYEEEGEEEYKMDESACQEEGEVNEYPEGEEDYEDDDEQAFARKVGVLLS